MASAKVEQQPLPERVGRYEVLLKVASGGMATVYLARARGIGGFEREVALKLMHAHLQESAEFANDLVEEAKLAVRIRHSNVASILDVGEDPLGIYLVMDFVEGDTLGGLFKAATAKDEKIPARIGLRILIDALAGLHAAHECKDAAGTPVGIVHRDFSPQNILVGLDGVARLTDFGIARAATRLSQTNTGIVKGKIGYMAPEQARGEPVDRRCDVWAAGVVAWQMLAGKKLHAADNDLAALLKIATVEPERLRTIDRRISGPLDEAIGSALTMDLARRCPTAAAFRQALLAAARAKNDLAEHDEVAEYVEKAAGPRLASRRERIAQLLALREKMGKLSDPARDEKSGETPSVVSAVPPPARSSAPALPRPRSVPEIVPEAPPAEEPELLDVEPDPESQRRTSDTAPLGKTVTAAASQPAPDEDPTREHVPDNATGTHTSTVSVATTDWVHTARSLPRRTKLLWGGVAAVGVAMFVTIVVLASGSSTPSTAVSTAASAPPAPVAASATADEPSVAAAPTTVSLMLHANAPIASARVGGRPVPVPSVDADVSLELPAADADGALRIDAYDARGRRASAVASPGAKHVTLVFGGGPPRATPAASSPFVTTSPYEKKK